MPNITIVRLSRENAALLANIAPDVFDEPVDPFRLDAYLAQTGHVMLVALSDSVVVGQCAAVIHRHPDKPTELYIDEIGVTPALHRQGIARRLLDTMLRIGREAGCAEAWVGTEHDNLPARALYEARGAAAEPFVLYFYDLLAET